MTNPVAGQETAAQVRPVPWRALAVVIICLSVFDVTLGLSYPLLSFLMDARGFDTGTIGLNAAMTAVGTIVAAPLVPRLVQRIGPYRFAFGGLLATALLFTGFKLSESLEAWYVLRFLFGAVIGSLFAVTEAWINELSTPATRGRIVAIYSSMLSLGFAVGPFILPFTGTEGWLPFVVGIGFIGFCLGSLFLIRDAVPLAPPEEGASLWAFLPLAPALLAAVGIFAVLDTSVMSLMPVYGLERGMDQATASYALGLLIVGNVILQFPIGWLADRVPRRAVLIGCAALTALGGFLIPLAFQSIWIWPLLFFWGSTGFGVYTMALAELGDRFKGSQLLAGTAAFAVMWGAGGIIGPPISGAAMEWFGPDGLPFAMGLGFSLFTLYAAWRALSARRAA